MELHTHTHGYINTYVRTYTHNVQHIKFSRTHHPCGHCHFPSRDPTNIGIPPPLEGGGVTHLETSWQFVLKIAGQDQVGPQPAVLFLPVSTSLQSLGLVPLSQLWTQRSMGRGQTLLGQQLPVTVAALTGAAVCTCTLYAHTHT